jgi:hypothetical protein
MRSMVGKVAFCSEEGNDDGKEVLDDLPRGLNGFIKLFRIVNRNTLSRRYGVVATGCATGCRRRCPGCRSRGRGCSNVPNSIITYLNLVSDKKRSID